MKIRGIFLDREKNTEKSLTIALPTPERVMVPLPAGSKALVKVGQWALAGQKLCEADVPAHASVSGKVEELRWIDDPAGGYNAVVIKADEDQKNAALPVPKAEDRESFIAAVSESGCVAAKLISAARDADTLIVNGTESEQYVTAEYRCMLDDGKYIAAGIELIKKYLGIETVYIAVSSDCTDAIAAMEKAAAEVSGAQVTRLRADHPNGAERVLVQNVTGRNVRAGRTAADKKVLILLPSEVSFIGRYFETGMPFIRRRVTVDGDLVKTPCVVEAPIGSPLSTLLDFADGNIDPAEKLVIGGLMTGRTVTDPELPLGKRDDAVLIFMKPMEAGKGSLKDAGLQTNCIKCGRCITACPVDLLPMRIEKALAKKRTDALKRLRPDLCIGCGSCTYVCPAKRELTARVKEAAEHMVKKEEAQV